MGKTKKNLDVEIEDPLLMGINEDIVEFKKKIQLSEGRRKAFYEQIDSEKKKNADKARNLKKEIKELHGEIGRPSKHDTVILSATSQPAREVSLYLNKSPAVVEHLLDTKILDLKKRLDLLKFQLSQRNYSTKNSAWNRLDDDKPRQVKASSLKIMSQNCRSTGESGQSYERSPMSPVNNNETSRNCHNRTSGVSKGYGTFNQTQFQELCENAFAFDKCICPPVKPQSPPCNQESQRKSSSAKKQSPKSPQPPPPCQNSTKTHQENCFQPVATSTPKKQKQSKSKFWSKCSKHNASEPLPSGSKAPDENEQMYVLILKGGLNNLSLVNQVGKLLTAEIWSLGKPEKPEDEACNKRNSNSTTHCCSACEMRTDSDTSACLDDSTGANPQSDIEYLYQALQQRVKKC